MNSYLSLLRKRPSFRLLWFAQVISMLGDWFNTIATGILVNRYAPDAESAGALGLLFVMRALPPFLLGPYAGVLADKFDRRTILIMTNVLRMFIVLGFLMVDSAEEAVLVYVFTLAQFTVSAFFEPAFTAYMPSLVEKDELLVANTLSSATWSAMLTIGAALGGFTAALIGIEAALIIDSATFGLAALLILAIQRERRPVKDIPTGGGWTEFLDGLSYIRQRPQIGWLTVVKGFGQFGNVDIVIFVFADRIFRYGEDGGLAIGTMFALHGLGAVLGPLVTNWIGAEGERRLYRWIIGGYLLFPIAWIMIGIPAYAIVLLGMFLRGAAGSINWTYSSVLLQTKVPGHYLGRVFGLDFTVFTLGMALSVYLTGLAFDNLDIAPQTLPLGLAAINLIPLTLWWFGTRQHTQFGRVHQAYSSAD